MRRISTFMAAAALALSSTAAMAAGPPDDPGSQGQQVDVIVVLEAGNPADVAGDHGVDLSFVYDSALNGFAGSVPEGRLNGLRQDRRVESVEFDRVVTIQAQQLPTGIDRIFSTDATGTMPPPLEAGEEYPVVAVFDTGIDLDHPDLNVVDDVNCTNHSGGRPDRRTYTCVKGGGDDDHYHGTHVAGTIAAIDNGDHVVGVAPGAPLYAVKVLDRNGSGSTSGIIAGIDWIIREIANGVNVRVANFSLGGSGAPTTAETTAYANLKAAGVATAVAAGNSDKDVSGYSPAGLSSVLTVSALADFDGVSGGDGTETCREGEVDDTLASFSNYGSGVDVIAPGVCILSTFPLDYDADGLGTISGTSMASPHVAGALAVAAAQDASASVDALYGSIVNGGNCGWDSSSDPDGVKEPLLDLDTGTNTGCTPNEGSGGGGTGGGGGEVGELTADVTYSFSGRKNRDLLITVTLSDPGARETVYIRTSDGTTTVSGAASTGDDHIVTFRWRGGGGGCYTTDVRLDSSSGTDIAESPLYPAEVCPGA